MQYAYEDRIAELRAKVDRTTSRQLLDQEQFDQKLDQIMKRQTALESRATALGAIPDARHRIDPPAGPRRGDPAGPTSGTPKPSPISDTVIFVAPPDREARLESRAPPSSPSRSRTSSPRSRVSTTCWSGCRPRSTRSSGARWRRLSSVEDSMESRMRRMRGVFTDLGLNMAQLEAATPRSASAAPSFPSSSPPMPAPFERQLYRINVTRAAGRSAQPHAGAGALSQARDRRGRVHLRFRRAQRSLPRPARDAYRPRFPRRDAAIPCAPPPTARWSSSGWMGGYGRMVEVDHGNGLSTRYGHLSEINVKVGDDHQDRPGDRRGRLDRPLHRSASALRNPHRRRRGRSAEILARRRAAQRGLGLLFASPLAGPVADLTGDDFAEQLPGFPVESHQLHLLDRK